MYDCQQDVLNETMYVVLRNASNLELWDVILREAVHVS